MPPRRIAVVSSSRADYAHLYWPLRAMTEHDALEPRLLVTGAHLAPEFGRTVEAIEQDGFPVAERIECLLSADSDGAMARTTGLATISFTDALERQRPDLLLLIADRYEMLAPAIAALALRIPVAHIEGGEASEWAIDHAVRNALTMLSHLHLTTTEAAAHRVVAMGEESWRVHRVGAPSLDHLVRADLLSRTTIAERLGFDAARPVLVVAAHPVTLERDTTVETDALFAALARLDGQIVFCFPNADAGSRAIAVRAEAFCASRADARLHVNLERELYWSLLGAADCMIGNSSSGIMESPSLGLPAVNVGRRQQGRERAANVIDVTADADAIVEAVGRARSDAFRAELVGLANPYGDGRASDRIAQLLADTPLGPDLLVKRMQPLSTDAACPSA